MLTIGPNHILNKGVMVSPIGSMKRPAQPAKDRADKTQEEISKQEGIPETSSISEGNNPDQPKGDKS